MDESLTMLVHGASKAGKSTLAVTSPAPRLLCDVESSARFLPIKRIKWDPKTDPPPKWDGTWDTCVVATRDWSTVDSVYQWLNSGKHDFKSFIIDSISELQNRYIEQEAGRKQMTQAQWGNAYRAVGGLVRDIRDLTMHPTNPLECIVMTAMTRQIDGKFRPWCQGQLQSVLPYLMDSVCYLYIDQERDEISGSTTEVRRLLTKASVSDPFEAGERVGGAWPQIITNPNVQKMIDAIFAEDPEIDEIEETTTTEEETTA